MTTTSETELTPQEARAVRIALTFGDPANASPQEGGPQPHDLLESAKRKLSAIEQQ